MALESLEVKAGESGLMERGEVESVGKMGWGHVPGGVGLDGVTCLGDSVPRFSPRVKFQIL